MNKLRLHQRYNKLIIAVAFVLLVVSVTVFCSVASIRAYATESTVAETVSEAASESASETKVSQSESESGSGTSEETGSSGEINTEPETSAPVVVNPTGSVKKGVSKLNVRTAPNTSSAVLTQVNGGLKLEILETVKVSDYKVWYKVSFFKSGQNYTGYIDSDYVVLDEEVDYSEDMDFEKYLDSQKFPESYKAGLRELHKKYPKWVFVAQHVDTEWSTMVSKQNTQARSLIAKSSISSWKSIETTVNADGTYSSPYYNWETSTWYPWDGGNWVQSSKELLEYTLDPRNFLNETNVFMFEKLSFDANIHTEAGLKNIVAGTFMENSTHDLSYDNKVFSYTSALLYAGQMSKVSPYHLATRIIQEQGQNGTGRSISGTFSGYEGYYNYFNVYASSGAGSDHDATIRNGLKYASDASTGTYVRPWNSRMRSILGGSVYLGSNYISIGQETIYYQKYDLIGYYGYLHQYMTHVLAPRSESVKAAKAYTTEMKANTGLVFYIPVYKNMPAEVCAIPTKNGSPNNTLASLSVEGQNITPSFGKFVSEYSLIVDYSVSSINVAATLADGTAKMTGNGTTALKVGDNKIDIVITAENGDVRTYTINVVRKEQGKVPETEGETGSTGGTEGETGSPGGTEGETSGGTEPPTSAKNQYDLSAYKLDTAKRIVSGFSIGDTIANIKSKIKTSSDVTIKVLKADGTDNTGAIRTGDKLTVLGENGSTLASYDVVVYGDVTGDGAVSLVDIVRIRRVMLGKLKVEGAYALAADCTKDGSIALGDIVRIRRHMLGKIVIEQ